MDCKNCNKDINSRFCPDCGQPTSLKRIDAKYIVHEIEHMIHLNVEFYILSVNSQLIQDKTFVDILQKTEADW